jgi:DNA-binding FadR family transcriptional regulator
MMKPPDTDRPERGERSFLRESQAHGRRLSDTVAALLLAELTDGEFAPGDRLPSAREMQMRFGVSRTVIREAIKVLAARGVVDVRPGAGVFVAPANISLMVDSFRILLHRSPDVTYDKVFEAREAIEGRIVELAVERALDSELDELRRVAGQLTEASTGDAFADADAEFHLALGALAHNELFRLLLGVVGGVMTEVRRQLAYVPGARDVVMTDHQRILDAVVARDAAAARQALEDHLANSQALVREFGEELLRKNWR